MFSHMAWALKQPIDDALAKWVLVTVRFHRSRWQMLAISIPAATAHINR